MKAKLNLSGEGIKNFFLNSGEKIVLVITVAILLAFLYSAITAQPLDDANSPEKIREKSTALESLIRTPSPVPPETDLAPTDYVGDVKRSMQPVAISRVQQPRPWRPPLFPELTKRADPKIFAVEEPQIVGVIGIVPYVLPADAGQAGTGSMPIAPPAATVERRGPASRSEREVPAQPAAGAAAAAALANQPARIDSNAMLPGSRVTPTDPQRRSMVIISALVPMEKQLQAFQKSFQSAVPAVPDPSKPPLLSMQPGQADVPLHMFYYAQRIEVKDANDTSYLNKAEWPKVDTTSKGALIAANTEWATWADKVMDLVSPEYLFQPLAVPGVTNQGAELFMSLSWPLPPQYLKDWGLEVTHPSQKIKLYGHEENVQMPQDIPQNNAGDAFNEGGAAGGNAAGMNAPPAPAAGPIANAPIQRPPVYMPSRGRSERDDHGELGRRPAGGGRGGFGQFPQNNWGGQVQVVPQGDVPYKLFRFIDFTAEPGKTYRYRVKLGLLNPNYGLKQECLDANAQKAKTHDVRFVLSDWSEPTPAVTVPRDFRLLANSAVGGRGGAEPQGKINLWAMFKGPISESAALAMGITAKDKETWLEGMLDVNVPLGGVASVRDAEFKGIVDINAGEVRPSVKGSVDTDQSMLLDIRNDDPLGTSRSTGPTEMLFIDSSGRVTIATSAVDRFMQADYTERTKVRTVEVGAAPVDERGNPKGGRGNVVRPRGDG